MKVFLLFLDGVGVGPPDPDINPLLRASLPTMTNLFGGRIPDLEHQESTGERGVAFGVDANLGVEGLPQSGTGQASIFTGINAAAEFGSHFGPYLPTGLRELVAEHSLFNVSRTNGHTAAFLNAYPQKYFEYTRSGTRRISAIVHAVLSAGLSLRTAAELERDEAVSADFNRDRWPELGHPGIRPIAAHDAGRHCAAMIAKNSLTVFDYWLPDHAGHARSMNQAVEVFERLDAFLGGVVDHVDLENVMILGISDHGNAEDLSTRSHTRNPALSFIVGKGRDAAGRLRSLTDVAPFVSECLNIRPSKEGG